MIQRKQSLWLLIAALLNACMLFTALYKWHEMVNGVDTVKELRVNDHYPSMVIVLVITLLPLLAIFMYNNRKRQTMMTMVSIVGTMSFIGIMLSRVTAVGKMTPPPAGATYWVGAVLPVISTLFLILAILGIRRDEKLVRSMDRLR